MEVESSSLGEDGATQAGPSTIYQQLHQHVQNTPMPTPTSPAPLNASPASVESRRLTTLLSPSSALRSSLLHQTSRYANPIKPPQHLAAKAKSFVQHAAEAAAAAASSSPSTPANSSSVTAGRLLHSFSRFGRTYHAPSVRMDEVELKRHKVKQKAVEMKSPKLEKKNTENESKSSTFESNLPNPTHPYSPSSPSPSVTDPRSTRRSKKSGSPNPTLLPEPVIRLRRSRHKQRLALAAVQSQRACLWAARPKNPFTSIELKDEDNTPSSTAPLSHDQIESTKYFNQTKALELVRRQQRFAKESQEIGLHDSFVYSSLVPVNTSNPQPLPTEDEKTLLLPDIDPLIYTPSSYFSQTTKDVLTNPWYTEPGPSSALIETGHAGSKSLDPSDYLKRDKRMAVSQSLMSEIERRATANVESSYQRALEANERTNAGVSQKDVVGRQVLNAFLSTEKKYNPNLIRTNPNPMATPSPSQSQSQSSGVNLLVTHLTQSGLYDPSIEPDRTAAEIFIGTAKGLAPMSDARIERANRAGLQLGPNQADGKQTELNTHHSFVSRHGVVLTSGLNPDQSVTLTHLARSLPYAVRITFRSARIRVSRVDLQYFMATLPGCTSVDEILLAPSLDQAYIAFHYNRYHHADAAVGVQPHVTGGRNGVECDGIQAVRLHQRIICADTPTPYSMVHKSDSGGVIMEQGQIINAGNDATDAHAQMRVLLRHILLNALIDEWSIVQMSALKARWHHHTLSHVADPTTLGPKSTLPLNTHTSTSTSPTSVTASTLMSQDTGHMFAPRGLSSPASTSAYDTAHKSKSHPSGSTTSHHIRRASSTSESRQRSSSSSSSAQLSWPDGLFHHLNRAVAQESYTQANNGSQTSRALLTSTPTTSSASSANSSSYGSVPLPSGLVAVQGQHSSHSARMPRYVPSSIAMPTSTFHGIPPSSLARAPHAPPPVSSSASGSGSLSEPLLDKDSLESHILMRHPHLHSSHPSAREGAPTLNHHTDVFLPTLKFFRIPNDMSHSSLAFSQSSSIDRLIASQQSSLEEEDRHRRREDHQQARQSQVRRYNGEIAPHNMRRMNRFHPNPNSVELVNHLCWSLNEQLEGPCQQSIEV